MSGRLITIRDALITSLTAAAAPGPGGPFAPYSFLPVAAYRNEVLASDASGLSVWVAARSRKLQRVGRNVLEETSTLRLAVIKPFAAGEQPTPAVCDPLDTLTEKIGDWLWAQRPSGTACRAVEFDEPTHSSQALLEANTWWAVIETRFVGQIAG